MKKLIFMILSLGMLFTSNVSADGNCPNWELSDLSGTTPPTPYCWQVSDIEGLFTYQSSYYYDEISLAGRSDSYFDFYAITSGYLGSTLNYGIYVFVEVYGYPQDVPKVTMDYLEGTLVSQDTVNSLSGDIVNGTRYKFFMPYIEQSNVSGIDDTNLNSTIRVYDGLSLKRSFEIK